MARYDAGEGDADQQTRKRYPGIVLAQIGFNYMRWVVASATEPTTTKDETHFTSKHGDTQLIYD